MKRLADAGNLILRIITGLLAAAFLLYGALMLRDMYLTEIKAFQSFDLMKYRPDIENDHPPYLEEMMKINKDTRGWLTIYGTNIDYPVMQGKNDMEYVNRDVYGEFSVTGSIFMASANSGDFSDPYTLVYGHHMTNGAMFGDLHKFKDRKFFKKNRTGIVIRKKMAYDLKVMAFLETDAYDGGIYDLPKEDLGALVRYVKKKAVNYRDVSYEKIIALSTCYNAKTLGRMVLICGMKVRTKPLPDREYGKAVPKRQPIGHPMAGAYFALMNLIILLVTLYFGARLIWAGRKDRDIILILVQLVMTLAPLILFVLTEDMHKPIQMIDKWTPLMLSFPLVLFLVSCRKIRKQNDPDRKTGEQNDPDNKAGEQNNKETNTDLK